MTQAVNSCTKRTIRDRYYSSMNYEEYFLLFGPPTPIVKPLDDPTQDIPELCLESNPITDQRDLIQPSCYLCPENESLDCEKQQNQNEEGKSVDQKSDPSIKQFQNTTNHTYSRKSDKSFVPENRDSFIRSRSKSDNSQYLIFSFLDRINKKGKKKIKLQ